MQVIDDLGHGESGESRPLKVLIIEDDRVQLSKLEALLVAQNMQPVCAASMKEARAAIAEHAFDAALVDVQLPDGSGLTIIPYLMNAEHPCACVVVTGSDDDAVVRRAVQLGVTQFLRKPCGPQRVRQALGMAVHRSRTMRGWLASVPDEPAQ